jgi:hypothetical protein
MAHESEADRWLREVLDGGWSESNLRRAAELARGLATSPQALAALREADEVRAVLGGSDRGHEVSPLGGWDAFEQRMMNGLTQPLQHTGDMSGSRTGAPGTPGTPGVVGIPEAGDTSAEVGLPGDSGGPKAPGFRGFAGIPGVFRGRWRGGWAMAAMVLVGMTVGWQLSQMWSTPTPAGAPGVADIAGVVDGPGVVSAPGDPAVAGTHQVVKVPRGTGFTAEASWGEALVSELEAQQQADAFLRISRVLDGRASWVVLDGPESAVGLAAAVAPARQRLLLVRLALRRHDGPARLHDVMVVPGHDAELAVTVDGRQVRYLLATTDTQPAKLSLWVQMSDREAPGQMLAAVATQIYAKRGYVHNAGAMAVSDSVYSVQVGVHETYIQGGES